MRLRAPGWRPTRSNISAVAVGIVLFISLLKVPATGARMIPPQSWEPVLCYASAHHLQWGVDIIFTFGPLGFLGADYYWGYLLLPTVLWGIWFALVMASSLLRWSSRIYPPIGAALLVALVLTPPVSHIIQDVVGILAIIVLILECFPDDEPPVTRLVLAGMTLAVMGQIKFTYLVFASLAIVLVGVAQLCRRRRTDAAITAGSFVLALVATCLAAGQSLFNLPEYLRQSRQVAQGYGDAMNLDCTALILAVGIVIAVLLLATIAFYWFPSRRNWQATLRAGLLGGGLFLMWKESYIRADDHVLDWFIFAIFFAGLMPAFFRVPLAAQRWSAPVFILVLLASVTGIAIQRPTFFRETANDLLPRLGDAATAIFAPPLYQSALDRDLIIRREENPLSTVTATVGRSTIDVLSLHENILINLGLNYTPHPVFQVYSAYAPEFQQLNLDFFNSEKAPEYLLWNYESSDPRYPTLNYGSLIVAIPRLYTPVVNEGGLVLWKRNALPPKIKIDLAPQKYDMEMGKAVTIGTSPCWIQLQWRQTWLGELRSFFYHPAPLYLDVEFTDQRYMRSRLVAGNASYGFLLQPCIATPSDLMQYTRDGSTANIVRAICVATDNPGCFENDLQCHISSVRVSSP
jgi:uncharacterized membrane protein